MMRNHNCDKYPVRGNFHLFVIAALIWGVPGIIITLRGFTAYSHIDWMGKWWLPLITIATGVSFYFIFQKIVRKYTNRILAFPKKVNIFMTFPLRGWILIVIMLSLGIFLKYQNVPVEFTASFYCGLGPMLIFSAVEFTKAGCNINGDKIICKNRNAEN